jgi:uncharacterized SAM-binding protein YcdF (DUF218 family)
MKVRRSRLLALLAGLVLLLVVALWAARDVGSWLVAEDPLVPSDAIFVLEGKTPHRELEAAALFRDGWAPRVVLALPRSDLSAEIRRLSGSSTEQESASRALRHAGVPDAAIVRLDHMVENTGQELRVDFDYARAHGFHRVILVSSPYHLRRIRIIWRGRFEGEIPAILRGSRYEPVDPARWWRSRRSLELVLHEVFGIAHFMIGSPLPTFAR